MIIQIHNVSAIDFRVNFLVVSSEFSVDTFLGLLHLRIACLWQKKSFIIFSLLCLHIKDLTIWQLIPEDNVQKNSMNKYKILKELRLNSNYCFHPSFLQILLLYTGRFVHLLSWSSSNVRHFCLYGRSHGLIIVLYFSV